MRKSAQRPLIAEGFPGGSLWHWLCGGKQTIATLDRYFQGTWRGMDSIQAQQAQNTSC